MDKQETLDKKADDISLYTTPGCIDSGSNLCTDQGGIWSEMIAHPMGKDTVQCKSRDTQSTRRSQSHLILNQKPTHKNMNTPSHQTQIIPKRLFDKGVVSPPKNMDTPSHRAQIIPKRLFDKVEAPRVVDPDRPQIGVEGMNVEILLLNTLIITAVKVQTVIEYFIKGKDYTTIFCLLRRR